MWALVFHLMKKMLSRVKKKMKIIDIVFEKYVFLQRFL